MIEMIVVVSILGLVAVMTSGFLLVSLTATGKAEVVKEVRQNGNYALSVMEGMILNSRGVGCTAAGTIQKVQVTDANGVVTNFVCDGTQKKISSVSAQTVDLTSSSVTVFGCDFWCEDSPGLPVKVHLGFTVQKGGDTDRPSEKASLEFHTDVMPRNLD
jgi:type II secretory pathway pseudopilin PulG